MKLISKKMKKDVDEGILAETSLMEFKNGQYSDSLAPDSVKVVLRDTTIIGIIITPDDKTCREEVSIGMYELRDFIETLQEAQVKIERLEELRDKIRRRR